MRGKKKGAEWELYQLDVDGFLRKRDEQLRKAEEKTTSLEEFLGLLPGLLDPNSKASG